MRNRTSASMSWPFSQTFTAFKILWRKPHDFAKSKVFQSVGKSRLKKWSAKWNGKNNNFRAKISDVNDRSTVFEIFIFCAKIQLWFSRKIVDFLGGEKLVKMLWFWDFLAVGSFDFTRKIVKKLVEKLVKTLLDKNLTFGIVCFNRTNMN